MASATTPVLAASSTGTPLHTLVLVGTPTLVWTILRTTLTTLPGVQLVGEARTAAEAQTLAATHRPDVILSTTPLAGGSALPLLTQLRRDHPTSTLILLAMALSPAELTALPDAALDGCLLWPELDAETLQHALAALLSGTVRVSSRGLPLAPRAPAAPALPLPAAATTVLAHLAQGHTHATIAAAEGWSVRTVERIVAALAAQLGASAPFVLGLRAAQLGLVAGPASGDTGNQPVRAGTGRIRLQLSTQVTPVHAGGIPSALRREPATPLAVSRQRLYPRRRAVRPRGTAQTEPRSRPRGRRHETTRGVSDEVPEAQPHSRAQHQYSGA
jgi:DNA-binding NarL/FixJ family response regulator